MDARGNIDLIGHNVVPVDSLDPEALPSIENFIFHASTDQGRWLERSMRLIGEWRAIFRSTYIQWALAINGLHIAAEKYSTPEWHSLKQFTVTSQTVGPAGKIEPVVLVVWPGDVASKAHIDTVPKMGIWGVIELFACFEDFLLTLYREFLTAHPESILSGDDFKGLRKLRRDAATGVEQKDAWEAALSQRLDLWQRNRVYDGLDRVLVAYFAVTGLKAPSIYKHTGPKEWGETLRAVAVLRNCLIHGAKLVPKELADLGRKPHGGGLVFDEGMPLRVTLLHLQCVHLFAEQLLRAINLSLAEHPDAGS
jgi:hypothetical protein